MLLTELQRPHLRPGERILEAAAVQALKIEAGPRNPAQDSKFSAGAFLLITDQRLLAVNEPDQEAFWWITPDQLVKCDWLGRRRLLWVTFALTLADGMRMQLFTPRSEWKTLAPLLSR